MEISASPQVCVAKCYERSCLMTEVCHQAVNEESSVTCACPEGMEGEGCLQAKGSLPVWAVIFIAVIAGLTALVGLGLCAFTCYRICRRRKYTYHDDHSDIQSISEYKPKHTLADYAQFTDIGSISRGQANLGLIAEESIAPSGVGRSERFKYGGGASLVSSRLSLPSEHGDPTPALNPYIRTDRHEAISTVSDDDNESGEYY